VSYLQIFGPDAGQKLFFDETMKQVVKDVLNGQHWLVYTYGITNSGKTHTIQGKKSTGCQQPVEGVVCFCMSILSLPLLFLLQAATKMGGFCLAP